MRHLRHLLAMLVLLVTAILVLPGCGQPKGPRGEGKAGGRPVHSEPHDHAHERGKMLIADAGKYHALLTAHLSKEGHELDIFFETQDVKNPTPVAIAHQSFAAEAKMPNGEIKPLKFEAAPADERPKDEKPGTCSHFVAKTPWLNPAEPIELVVRLKLNGKEITARWKDFIPKKYAHHED